MSWAMLLSYDSMESVQGIPHPPTQHRRKAGMETIGIPAVIRQVKRMCFPVVADDEIHVSLDRARKDVVVVGSL